MSSMNSYKGLLIGKLELFWPLLKPKFKKFPKLSITFSVKFWIVIPDSYKYKQKK